LLLLLKVLLKLLELLNWDLGSKSLRLCKPLLVANAMNMVKDFLANVMRILKERHLTHEGIVYVQTFFIVKEVRIFEAVIHFVWTHVVHGSIFMDAANEEP
jgi:hypothetical protein